MTTLYGYTSYDIPAPVGVNTYISVTGVDAAGEAVGYYGFVDGDGDSTDYAFVGTGGVATRYAIPGASNLIGIGVTSSGEIWGSYTDNYNRDQGFVVINGVVDEFAAPLATATYVTGVTDGGVIYGYFNNGSNLLEGFVYHYGYSIIAVPGASSTIVTGVNASGEIVGTVTDATGAGHGFTDSNGVFTTFSVPGATDTFVAGVSDAGVIAGTYVDASNNAHGFIDNNGVVTTFDAPGSSYTNVTAENASGEIVGFYVDGAGNVHGFVDENGFVSSVDVPGATQTSISGVAASGEIFGFYNDVAGVQHGFAAQTDPVVAATDDGAAEVGIGHVVTITLNTAAAETVTGAPTLQLSDNEVATYVGGSGTTVLRFSYTVQPGDGAADLQVTGLDLPSGATIADAGGQALSTAVTADLGLRIITLVTNLTTAEDHLVYLLYQAAFDRMPDYAGLEYWAGQADAQQFTALHLADIFIAAPEFSAKYGANPDNDAFVGALYSNVLGRTPDAAGLAYWEAEANAGTPRDQLLVDFATSTENLQITASHTAHGYWVT